MREMVILLYCYIVDLDFLSRMFDIVPPLTKGRVAAPAIACASGASGRGGVYRFTGNGFRHQFCGLM